MSYGENKMNTPCLVYTGFIEVLLEGCYGDLVAC